MKTRRLRTIAISAYLSAMLASSVQSASSDETLAGTIDSTASPATVSLPKATLSSVPVSQSTDPIISEELMARLIKRTSDSKKEAVINARMCKAFAICDGASDVPAKQVGTTEPDGKHYFAMLIKEGSPDIIVALKQNGVTNAYLTDKSGRLRAALIFDPAIGPRLITNEQAAEKFEAELRLFAKLAEDLPPTGAVVAGDS